MAIPLHGRLAVSGTAQLLASASSVPTVAAFSIKAPQTNLQPVFIGSSTVTVSNGHQLDPGDEISYERLGQNGQPRYVLSVSDFYAVGTSPDVVTWLASP